LLTEPAQSAADVTKSFTPAAPEGPATAKCAADVTVFGTPAALSITVATGDNLSEGNLQEAKEMHPSKHTKGCSASY
jgi:hypothetical protein